MQPTGQPKSASALSLASGSRRLHSRTRAAIHWWDWEGQAADTGAAGRRTLRLQSPVSLQCRVIGEPYSDHRRAPQATTACQDRVSGQSVRAAAGRRVSAGPGGFSCLPGAAGRAVGFHGSRAAGPHSNISSGQHHGVHVRSQSGTAIGREPAGPRVSSGARQWFSSCTGRHLHNKGVP